MAVTLSGARSMREAHPLASSLVISLFIALIAGLVGFALTGDAGIALGAVTLAQASLLSQDTLARGVMETFVIESPVLDRLPFETIEGNSFAYNEELTLPGVEFRAVNTPYSESTGTLVQKSEKLVDLGGEVHVDDFIVKTRGNLNGQRAIHTGLKVKSLSHKFQDSFINADVAVDANGFDGLKKRIVGAQVLAAGANGLPILGADDAARQTFLDQLEALITLVPGCDALYMNAGVRTRVLSAMRRLNIQTMPVGVKREATYNGLPLIDIGSKADGTAIIPQTETQGTSAIASSIYAVRFGTAPEGGGVMGLTNGGVQVIDLGRLQAKPAWGTRITFYTGVGIFSGKAAARLTGVQAS